MWVQLATRVFQDVVNLTGALLASQTAFILRPELSTLVLDSRL